MSRALSYLRKLETIYVYVISQSVLIYCATMRSSFLRMCVDAPEFCFAASQNAQYSASTRHRAEFRTWMCHKLCWTAAQSVQHASVTLVDVKRSATSIEQLHPSRNDNRPLGSVTIRFNSQAWLAITVISIGELIKVGFSSNVCISAMSPCRTYCANKGKKKKIDWSKDRDDRSLNPFTSSIWLMTPTTHNVTFPLLATHLNRKHMAIRAQ